MKGRKLDELSIVLLIIAAIAFAIFVISESSICFYSAILLIVYTGFRTFSDNTKRRNVENDWLLNLLGKKNKVNNGEFLFFDCPKCGQKMKAPKGKGRIRVTCSSCGFKFETEV